MGLEEKRRLSKLKEDTFPKFDDELKQITGADIHYDIDWDSFASSIDAMNALEQSALPTINAAFRDLCRDKIGKDAVQESIKKIHLAQGTEAQEDNFSIKDGTLDLPWDWASWPTWLNAEKLSTRLGEML